MHWSEYKMTTPRDCSDNFLEYYDRTTRPADRQRVYCDAKLDTAAVDRRSTSNVAHLRLFAAAVHRLPHFVVVYTPFVTGESTKEPVADAGESHGRPSPFV